MIVLVTGAAGQLGRELVEAAPAEVELHALARTELDVTDAAAVGDVVQRIAPTVILNAAAYTKVDAAESEPEAAYAVNEAGAGHLADAAATVGARLIHVSTDFVFDGHSGRPYRPEDAPAPVNVYGASKLAGEKAVLDRPASRPLVVRSSWIYSAFGANFVKTMLRLMRERDSLDVVADQIGSPTWAAGLARMLWACAARPDLDGILHWCDAGVASRYDFAVAIAEEAQAAGMLADIPEIRPVGSADFRLPASRPPFSVLDTFSNMRQVERAPKHWRTQLRAMLHDLQGSDHA